MEQCLKTSVTLGWDLATKVLIIFGFRPSRMMVLVDMGVLEVGIPVEEAKVAAAAMELAVEEKSGPCCHGNGVISSYFFLVLHVCCFNLISR